MSVKVQLTSTNGVKKTVVIKEQNATDQHIVNFVNSYVSLLENNDTTKAADKIVTTALSVA